MLSQFKAQVSIDGTTFKKGLHHVSEKIFDHPHFAQYVKAGVIVDPESEKAKKALPQETPFQRSERIAKQIKDETEAQLAKRKTLAKTADASSGPQPPTLTDHVGNVSKEQKFSKADLAAQAKTSKEAPTEKKAEETVPVEQPKNEGAEEKKKQSKR
jgi:hypothetical protein